MTDPTSAPQEPAVEGIEAAAICRVVIEELAYTYEAGYTGAQMQEAVRQTLLTAVQPLLAALAAEKAAREQALAERDRLADIAGFAEWLADRHGISYADSTPQERGELLWEAELIACEVLRRA